MFLLVCDVQGCENAELVPNNTELHRVMHNAGWSMRTRVEAAGVALLLVCPADTERIREAEDELERRLLAGAS